MSRIIKSEKIEQIANWDFPNVESDVSLLTSATHIAHTTETKIEDIRTKNANEEIKQLKQKAYQEAKHEALQQFSTEWQTNLQALHGIIAQLTEPLLIIDNQLEEQLKTLVLALTRKLVKHELSVNPEQVLTVIIQAKELLPISKQKVQLQISKDDFELVTSNLPPKLVDQITVDNSLQRGECRLITDTSEIDGSYEARLETLITGAFNHEK